MRGPTLHLEHAFPAGLPVEQLIGLGCLIEPPAVREEIIDRNFPVGLRYVVAGLGQLGLIEEAQAPLAELKKLDTSAAYVESLARRVFKDATAAVHFADGLRKAGME